jgi:hypothetical protein
MKLYDPGNPKLVGIGQHSDGIAVGCSDRSAHLSHPEQASAAYRNHDPRDGGIGKSVLARALCDAPDIKAAFADGILWATLGQTPDLIARLREWIDDARRDRGAYHRDLPGMALALSERV